MPETEILEASAFDAVEALEAGDSEFLFMPAGKHEIRATVNGKPATRTVIVEA